MSLKTSFLSRTLTFALELMLELNWRECCQKAIDQINECDKFEYFKDTQTVMDWHRKWRV